MRFYKRKIFWVYVCAGMGFLGGILFILFSGDTYLKTELLWEAEVLQKLKEMTIDKKDCFLWLLCKRGKIALAVWLLGYSVLSFPILLVLSSGIGMILGVFLTVSVVQMKTTGVLLICGALFPQIVFYLFAGKMLADSMVGEENERHSPALFFSFTACVVAGAVLEACVNPEILRFVIKKFL